MIVAKPIVSRLLHDYKVDLDEHAMFVDESGDARLKDPNNRLFILSACITSGGSMNTVAQQWRDVRQALCGDPDKPVHFKDRQRRSLRKSRNREKLCAFFDKADVGRLAVSMTERKGIDLTDAHGRLVIRVVFERLLYEHSKLNPRPYNKLTVIFEDSPMMRHVYQECRGLTFEVNKKEMPLQFYWITKRDNAPWMEIADGIAHTWAGVVRGDPRGDFNDRRRAIFAPANLAPARARQLSAEFSQRRREDPLAP